MRGKKRDRAARNVSISIRYPTHMRKVLKVNAQLIHSRRIANGKLLCYSSHTSPMEAVNSKPYIKMINFTQMSTS